MLNISGLSYSTHEKVKQQNTYYYRQFVRDEVVVVKGDMIIVLKIQ